MQVLLSEETIRRRVVELGEQIAADYRDRPLTVLGVLTGSLMFVADLVRRIDVPLQIGFLQASSYRGESTAAGELQLNPDFTPDVVGRDVLLVDDILDTGHTLSTITSQLADSGAVRVSTAVLLWKRERTVVDIQPDYTGFEIPDEFVIGYGLDYNDQYRHLPHIAIWPGA